MLGREDLSHWLTDALQKPGCAVALHAGPGMGKSTLLRACTDEGAVWVSGLVSPEQVATVAVPSEGLLVLDTPELSDDAWQALADRRALHAGLRVVVASRQRPPAGWVSVFVPPLSMEASVALLRARSGLPADGFSDLAADLGGVPLALELAASRVRLLGVRGVRERVGAQLLTSGAGPSTSMRTVLRWSWSSLSDDGRAAARLLALFSGHFSPGVASRVLGPGAFIQLSALQDAGLLVRSSEGGLLLPVHARAFVAPMVSSAEVQRWVIGCLAACAEATDGPLLSGPLKDSGAPPLSRADLTALVQRATDVRHAQAVCVVLADTIHGVVDTAERRALLAEVPDDPLLPARLRGELCLLRAEAARGPDARIPGWLEESTRSLSQAAKPRIDAAFATHAMRSGRTVEAQALLERALPGLPPPAQSPLAQRALLRLGACLGQQCKHREAGMTWAQLARIPDEKVVPVVALRAMRNAAQAANNTQGGHGATVLLERGRLLAESLGLHHWTANFRLHLAVQKHLEEDVVERISEDLVRTIEAGPEFGMGWNARVVWTRTAVESGDEDWARLALRAADELLGELALAQPHIFEAKLLLASMRGDFEAARVHADRLREVFTLVGQDAAFVEALVDPNAPVPEPNPGDLFAQKLARLLQAARGPRLTVDPSGFSFDGQERVDLHRRGPARRLMWHLAQQSAPSDAQTLVRVGWPGESIRWDAAKNRLHVTLSLLRKLGLRDALACTDGAWHVCAGVRLEIRES